MSPFAFVTFDRAMPYVMRVVYRWTKPMSVESAQSGLAGAGLCPLTIRKAVRTHDRVISIVAHNVFDRRLIQHLPRTASAFGSNLQVWRSL